MSAGHTPMVPVSGIKNASSASEGTVWMRPVARSTGCSSRRCLAATMPSGTPTRIAAASEANTSARCCASRRPKSGANKADQKERRPPFSPPRYSAATCAKGTLSISAWALSRTIVALSIPFSSLFHAAKASGNRFGASAR